MGKIKLQNSVYVTLAGILWTILIGTLLHFTYKWSRCNPFVGLFSPTNESTWEHMKMIFFPMVSFIIVQSIYFKNPIYLTTGTVGLILSLILVPSLFYTYTFFLGEPILFLDIAIFIIAIIAGFLLQRLFVKKKQRIIPMFLAISLIIILYFLFFYFTIYPPNCFLFFS